MSNTQKIINTEKYNEWVKNSLSRFLKLLATRMWQKMNWNRGHLKETHQIIAGGRLIRLMLQMKP